MKKIFIPQLGRKCQLWHGDDFVTEAGRVEIKRRAVELHQKTGDPVFNVKKGGDVVEVKY